MLVSYVQAESDSILRYSMTGLYFVLVVSLAGRGLKCLYLEHSFVSSRKAAAREAVSQNVLSHLEMHIKLDTWDCISR